MFDGFSGLLHYLGKYTGKLSESDRVELRQKIRLSAISARDYFRFNSTTADIYFTALAEAAKEFGLEYDPFVEGKMAADLAPVKLLDRLTAGQIGSVSDPEVVGLKKFLLEYARQINLAG